ncbi:related to alpha-1,2-mannosidase subfamily [Cephalotrichum gorgonifer]|uniref:Related to alpha-1,2-mannosidase subfamily n=1 Tax=Cephalotrichum gorgonifer TaxID=2041049 RepID=A0AAE8N245_9PEZI|nr:related to alpha-1,2-mannosidase subfamily [Cephalotrichum gorgonifer]
MALVTIGADFKRPLRLLVALAFVTYIFFCFPRSETVTETRPWIPPSRQRLTPTKSGDPLEYIDPLIGTINGGHVFPGPTHPYGMAKPCPDAMARGENAAGFVSDDSHIGGFSHLHDSGTGGNPSLGTFPLFAHPGCPLNDYTKCRYATNTRMINRVPDSVEARVGYFSINLANHVHAEMAASMRTALYRFTFPPDPVLAYETQEGNITAHSSPLLLVDLQDLGSTSQAWAAGCQVYPESGRMIGEGMFLPSFGRGTYTAYFCADFRGAEIRHVGTFTGDDPVTNVTYMNGVDRGFSNPSGSGGPWIQFERPPTDQIVARVGMSFKSVDQACANAEREIPDFDFEGTVARAEDAWREKLGVVELDVSGVSRELQTVFWSGLYRSLVSPQNYTGENQLWDSTEPYFDSFYCIWDSFRAQHPLLSILDPPAQTEMVRALIDIYRHVGKLPDCRMSFCKGYTQGGSNADVVLADAYIKNLTGGVDWETAYEAVLSDAEDTPKDWGVEGRGNIESWEQYGYIAADHRDTRGTGPHTRSVSRTLEYAYDDFSIAVLARALGHEDDHAKYMNRSGFWRNVWNADQTDMYFDEAGDIRRTSFRGFPQPRLMDGTFKYQNTRVCSPGQEPHKCYFDTALSTYEGSPWLYSFYAPQDMSGLIETFGGDEAFLERLDYYHSSEIAYMGNEQSYLTVFQFHYAGRPGRSSYWVNEYIPSQFNASLNGIPGNDDCAMGAFAAMAMMGFFPVAGQSVYLLTAPFFPEVRLRSRVGGWDRPAVIRSVREGDAGVVEDEGSLRDAIYIQSARLDGKPYTKNWISHDFFEEGGLLELTLGTDEGSWGTGQGDLPPSFPAFG